MNNPVLIFPDGLNAQQRIDLMVDVLRQIANRQQLLQCARQLIDMALPDGSHVCDLCGYKADDKGVCSRQGCANSD
jgi:hypothetical protein